MTSKHVDVPTVSFRIVSVNDQAIWDHQIGKHANLNRNLLRSFGYNSRREEPWTRPKHYIRYIEPIESELAVQVEYDMDEQDREWVKLVNQERQAQHLDSLSYELFEVIMDKLEKEWFDLVKKIPAPASLPIEDSKCAICDDGEGENSNAIVFCDGCNLAVHQDCYGIPYIPEGQWLCRKCTVEPENPVDCILCPAEAGAFKQTTDARWAHLLCAIWIPEIGVSNPVYMEPIEGAETIPKSRWKLNCSICRVKMGACIQCDNKNCFTAFHVTCARARGNLGSMKTLLQDGILRAYCDRHMPADQLAAIQALREAQVEAEDGHAVTSTSANKGRLSSSSKIIEVSSNTKIPEIAKAARAHAKKYTQGPPLVPAMIVDRILVYIQKARLRKMRECIETICRYWSLKREARRGAPLLKRLYLEPWTASNASHDQTDAEKAKKLEYMRIVREDLERVRMLVELSHKREKEKSRQARALQDFIEDVLFPHDSKLRLAFQKITSLDRQQAFTQPVSVKDVPDYLDIIKEPICWQDIDEKLDAHAYVDLAQFQRHVFLVLENAMLYNPSDHPYHRLALKIKKVATSIFAELFTQLSESSGRSIAPGQVLSLEPSRELLDPLLVVEPGSNRDRLAELFVRELEPLPPPSPLPKYKPILTHEERQARRQAKIDERKARAEALRLVSSRQTRSNAPVLDGPRPDENMLPKELRPPAIKTKINRNRTPDTSTRVLVQDQIPPRSLRTGRSSALSAFNEGNQAILPSIRKQTGVIGTMAYSPLTDQERRARERDMELVVDTVDNKDYFERFNVGFILPEGTKRGGRPFVPSAPVAGPSRRRQANMVTQPSLEEDHGPATTRKSSTPVVPESSDISDAPEDSDTITVTRGMTTRRSARMPASIPAQPEITSPRQVTYPMEASSSRASTPLSPAHSTDSLLTPISSPSRRSLTPKSDATLLAEESKNLTQTSLPLGRSTRSAKLLPDSMLASAEPASGSGRVAKRRRTENHANTEIVGVSDRRSSRQRHKPVELEQEIAKSLIDTTPPELSSSRVRAATSKPKNSAVPKSRPRLIKKDTDKLAEDLATQVDWEADPIYRERIRRFHGLNGTKEEISMGHDDFLPGTLVWAKSSGHPFWPGSVVHVVDEYETIPEAVWSMRPDDTGEPVRLVQFYDKGMTYAWCKPDKLANLGDDNAVDEIFLSGKDKPNGRTNARWNKVKKGVHIAYGEALKGKITTDDD